MARTRLDTEEVFKSIMGKKPEPPAESLTPLAEPESKEPQANKSQIKPQVKERFEDKEKLVQTAFYITPRQRKALKIKAATDGTPQNKDQSAIVRAALDAYLADTLETM